MQHGGICKWATGIYSSKEHSTQLGWGQYLWLKARACKGHALCAGVWQLQCILYMTDYTPGRLFLSTYF